MCVCGGEGALLGQCGYGGRFCVAVCMLYAGVRICPSVWDKGWGKEALWTWEWSHSGLTPLTDSWEFVDLRAGESSSNPNFATFQLCCLSSFFFSNLGFLIYRVGSLPLLPPRADWQTTLGECQETGYLSSLWGERMRKEFPFCVLGISNREHVLLSP